MSIEGDMMRDSPEWQRQNATFEKRLARRNQLRGQAVAKYPEIVAWLAAEFEFAGDAGWHNLGHTLEHLVGGS